MKVFSDELIDEYKKYTGLPTLEVVEIIKKLKCSANRAITYYAQEGRFPNEELQLYISGFTESEFRGLLGLEKQIQQRKLNRMINTDKEYAAGLRYIASKYISIATHYDSDMGLGAGVVFTY